MNTPEICAYCKHNRKDWTNPQNEDYYCGNEESDNYGMNTMYSDACEDWEEKE